MDIITATEAHRITEEAASNSFKELLERAINQIITAARKGRYNTDICINAFISSTIPWSDNDNEHFVNALKELGYKTQKIRKELTYPDSNECLYFVTVSW